MNKICKICGADTEEFFDPALEISYDYCHHCQFISQDETTLVSKKEEKAEYDLHENTFENEGYVNMFRSFINKAVIPFIGSKENMVALDFGSGPEPVLAKLLTNDFEIEADIYDLYYSPEKIYKGKKYDLITSTEVVEHLVNPMDYFSLFKSLLKEGGTISIMTLFHSNNQEEFLKWYYRRELTHISFFTVKTMEYIAKKLEMKLVYTDGKRYSVFSIEQ